MFSLSKSLPSWSARQPHKRRRRLAYLITRPSRTPATQQTGSAPTSEDLGSRCSVCQSVINIFRSLTNNYQWQHCLPYTPAARRRYYRGCRQTRLRRTAGRLQDCFHGYRVPMRQGSELSDRPAWVFRTSSSSRPVIVSRGKPPLELTRANPRPYGEVGRTRRIIIPSRPRPLPSRHGIIHRFWMVFR
jgi:hypothetical protein